MTKTRKPVEPFHVHLRKWRTAAGLSQRKLDDALGKNRGYTHNYENGTIRKPPDRTTCTAIAEVLGVPAQEVWDAACRDRLEKLGPDVLSWLAFRRGLSNLVDPEGGPLRLSEDEARLLGYLRWLSEAEADDPALDGLADVVADILLGLLYEWTEDDTRKSTDTAHELVRGLRQFATIPTDQQRLLVHAMVATVRAMTPPDKD